MIRQEGIRFRGKTIPETFAALPKVPGSDYPYVEAFWWFLLTGEVPTEQQTLEVVKDFKSRRAVPAYVVDMLRAMPRDTHPMTMFSGGDPVDAAGVALRQALQRGDEEGRALGADVRGLPPTSWPSCPRSRPFIYRLKYKDDKQIPADPKLDLGGNFAHMMGFPKPYDDVARMYFILHSDHESGNVSAHTTHLVASALSDAYYALSAGINGLAGPLHGLANQEVLGWIMKFQEKLGGKEPTEENVKQALWDTLNAGQVIPGYGHAVLRKTDPRYIAQMEFCQKHLPRRPAVQAGRT